MAAALSPLARPANLCRGDVFFTVIDARPEKKKLHRDIAHARSGAEIVIRLHKVAVHPSIHMVAASTIVRVDLGAWCCAPGSCRSCLLGLLRCDNLQVRSIVSAARARSGASAPLADGGRHVVLAPRAPAEGELLALRDEPCEDIVTFPSDANTAEHAVLQKVLELGVDRKGLYLMGRPDL